MALLKRKSQHGTGKNARPKSSEEISLHANMSTPTKRLVHLLNSRMGATNIEAASAKDCAAINFFDADASETHGPARIRNSKKNTALIQSMEDVGKTQKECSHDIAQKKGAKSDDAHSKNKKLPNFLSQKGNSNFLSHSRNFASPIWMRSPDPEDVPFPCGFVSHIGQQLQHSDVPPTEAVAC